MPEELDLENPQPTGQEDGTVDGIVNGIVDLLDNPDPNHSATVQSRAEEPTAETAEEPAPETPPASEEPTKQKIKWQGQEKEVTQEELLELASKGFDYTQKTQALAQERDNLAPYVGLANQIKGNPILASQIAALMTGQPPQAQPREPEKPKFDDPIEQLKWETRQEALAEARKEIQQAVLPIHRQQALNSVKQQIMADPDYREVHQKIIEMVQSQPPALQRTMYTQLDQDPQAYVEAFQFFKNQKAQAPQPPAAPATTPKPVKKETHAPILESGGVAAPEGIEGKAKAERIAKQKAKALRSGDPTEIASWLQSSGAIDHLY